MRIESGSLTGCWPASATRHLPSGLTARRFVDFGRTGSMMCRLVAR